MFEWLVGKIWCLLIIFIILCIRNKYKNQAINPPERSFRYDEIVHMDFKQVRDIYLLNPDRLKYQKLDNKDENFNKKYLLMNISDPMVAWERIEESYFDRYRKIPCDSRYIVAIAMSPKEAIKFHMARKKKPNNVRTEEKILQIMQKDVNKLRQKARDEISQAKDIVEKII